MTNAHFHVGQKVTALHYHGETRGRIEKLSIWRDDKPATLDNINVLVIRFKDKTVSTLCGSAHRAGLVAGWPK